MKNVIVISLLILLSLFLLVDNSPENSTEIIETYPWQITILPDGKSRIFGFILEESTLKEVDVILKATPKVALFELDKKIALEAYYKNVSLGGLIGSFIFTLNASDEQHHKIKQASVKQERVENNGKRYDLDKPTSDGLKSLVIKNLIYIPTVQLDEETIIKRFGKPAYKIKLKTKEKGWHYLYPEKGLDLIYKEEGKEVLQYVLPKNFNVLLAPLQSH